MSEGKSSLLFTKDGNESQEDIWDDTALIRAYEKSVKSIREKLDSKLILEARDKPKENLEIKEKLNDLDSDDDDIEENNYEDYSGGEKIWKILDLCTAVYSEDGLYYPATIIKIYGDDNVPYEKRKCLIQYLEYLNEEEKYLSELMEYNPADFEGLSNEATTETAPVIETTSKKSKDPLETRKYTKNVDSHRFEGFSIPPPPPPPMISTLMNNSKNDKSVTTDEALHSMLLSWYMSGYHTGYYIGQSQK